MNDRAARIEEALAERLARRTGIPPFGPGPAPLSPVQRSLWILAQLAEGEPVNARPLHVRLLGSLDTDALAAALTALVDRHQILRTTFPMIEGEPVQVVGEVPAIDLPVVDLSVEPDSEVAALAVTGRHADAVFDLTREAPFRPALLRLGCDEHVLSIAMHHIVFDGWSEQRFLDELAVLYDASVDGVEPPLAPLPVQARDAAAWLAGQTDENHQAADLAWWEERLASPPPDLELPVDRPPLDADPHPPVDLDLGVELTEALRDLGRRHDATLFMVLMSAVQTLMMRLTGQRDLIVGFPAAGRSRPETEPLIGCFIDTIAVRSRLDPDDQFSTQLETTRRDVLEALSHTGVPFSRVMGAIRPWTGGDRTPLYRVHLQLRNFPGPIRTSRHLEIEPFGMRPGEGSHLSVRGDERDGSLHLSVLHDPARFRTDTVRRWVGALRRILEAVAGGTEPAIGDLELTGSEELALVGGGWDGPPEWETPPPLAADLLRSAAGRWPEQPAMVHGERQVTYAEFDRMVDRAADALQRHGLGAEDAVVLFLDRSVEAAVAIFAALRAGVAYVPVDTELTAAWLTTVVGQLGPGMVVADAHHRGALAEVTVPIMTVEELISAGAGRPAGQPARQDLAYVLYTSGSTGVPKGVMVEQGNLAAFLAADAEVERSVPGDRVLWFHSMSFDAVAKGLHVPLASGATVVIRNEEALRSIPRFLAWCEEAAVTHLPVPTSFAHVLLEEAVAAKAALPSRLTTISFGGEQARADIVEGWLARYGDRVRLRNTYGPTEATIWLTSADLSAADAPFGRVPIGRPTRGVKVRVRDERGHLVPVGVSGELMLGGSYVARGYLSAPELTAERFSTDADGVRWYRSGDLGRWLPDGKLEVLGRFDRQVKIHGYRVEPAEIEAVLRAMPEVGDAVVVVLPGRDGELALHAYAESRAADAGALTSRLGTALPPFLRPSTLTVLERFPRAVSGKLDVRRLPEPGIVSGDGARRPAATGGLVETLGEIWAEVLDVDRVQPDDGFFELGGHSLLAIRVISRIRDRLGVEIPLPALFTHPTLAELATVVAEAAGETAFPAAGAGGAHPRPVDPPEPDLDLATLLDEIESLSDEEAAALLARLEAEGGAG